jgi:hypothetical protein
MKCTAKELQMLVNTLIGRRRMLAHLQKGLPEKGLHIRTNHLRPPSKNFRVHPHDFTSQNGNMTFACGGYLSITVCLFKKIYLQVSKKFLGSTILLCETWPPAKNAIFAMSDPIWWRDTCLLLPI